MSRWSAASPDVFNPYDLSVCSGLNALLELP